MSEPVTCERCAHFRSDPINQQAGLGFCPIFNGYNYLAAKRYCREFEEKRDAASPEA